MAFQVGDILFVRGDTFMISPGVKLFLESEYSHVAIAAGPDLICEIDVFKKLNIIKNPYQDYDLYRYQGELNPFKQQKLLNFLNKKIATCRGYDWGKILELCIRRFLHWEIMINEKNRYICSEIIDETFNSIGIDLVGQRVTGDVTPVDLLHSIYLKQVKENERHAS